MSRMLHNDPTFYSGEDRWGDKGDALHIYTFDRVETQK